VKKLIASILLTVYIVCCSAVVFGNSGPTYWEGYPSSDVMLVEENSPITVKNEDLVFDFSDYELGHTISGRVTATYNMMNPTDKQLSVQMAFPFVARVGELSSDDVVITVGGTPVPYDTYIGDTVNSYGASEEDSEASFDFKNILNTITKEAYKAESFTENEKGKLYSIYVNPTTDQSINFALDFNFDFNKTKVLTSGFNRYERDGSYTRIAAWCCEPEVLQVYVLGEDINFNINAYTDGELSKKTDLFTFEIDTKEVELRPYLINFIKNNRHGQNTDMFSDNQLYNVYAKALDRQLDLGFTSGEDLLGQEYSQRILTLVYTVEFPANSEKEVSVSCKTSGTMDRRETKSPLYTFEYILNPAKNWRDFKNLHIEIVPPREAPHIVKSSIQFTKGEDNAYTATLYELPDEDLSFTLYAHEKITFFDKIEARLKKSLMYFAFFRIFALPIIIIGIIIVLIRKRGKEIRK